MKIHELNNIKKTIALIGGKGGVGKSLVTSLLAVLMRRKGYKVGVLDGDIIGPSILKAFITNSSKVKRGNFGIFPARTNNGIKVMSVNLLLGKNDDPIIWTPHLIEATIKMFWVDVLWGDLDCLFYDMPVGTEDNSLTVFKSIPLDGIIIVAPPQDYVSPIMKKAYNIAKIMNIPILGIIENMGFAVCPECGKEINVFGESKTRKLAKELGITYLGRLPFDMKLAGLCNKGDIEKFDGKYADSCVDNLEKILLD